MTDNKKRKILLHLKKHWMIYAILVSFVFSIAVFLLIQPSFSYYTESEVRVVVINKYYSFLINLAGGAVIFCLVLTYIKKNIPLVIIVTLLLPPLSFFGYFYNGIAPWQEFGTVSDSKGNKYCFLDSSFLQGQTLAIGCMISDDILVRKYKILVSAGGDSPRWYTYLMRPEGAKDSYGQLYIVKNEWLLGVRYLNQLYLAYNLKKQKSLL